MHAHLYPVRELGGRGKAVAWDVPDPVFGGLAGHEEALDLIEDGLARIGAGWPFRLA